MLKKGNMSIDIIHTFVTEVLLSAKATDVCYSIIGGYADGKIDLCNSSDIDLILREQNDLQNFLKVLAITLKKYPEIKLVQERKTSSGVQLVLACFGQVVMFDLMAEIRFHNFSLIDSRIYFELENGAVDAKKIAKFIKAKTGFKQAWPGVPSEIYSFKVERISWFARSTYFLCKTWEICKSLLSYKSGLFVVVLGPDGSGKSTVIESLAASFCGKRSVIPVFRFHWRAQLLNSTRTPQIVTDPHGSPARSRFMSVVKLAYLGIVFTMGYWLKLHRLLHRGCVVLFDRYYYDMLVDACRYRYSGPMWMARLVGRCIPCPDLVVLLDASPEILQSRKQEVPFEETARQRNAYLGLVQEFPNRLIVDASKSVESITREVSDAILGMLERRLESQSRDKVPK